MWTKRLFWLLALLAVPASAADRHVYLASTTSKACILDHTTLCTTIADCPSSTACEPILTDCPNPAHGASGIAGSTALLQECSGGTQSAKVIGTATGRTTAVNCTSGGGAVLYMQNGMAADVDNDGTNEAVYGHPQACVWDMNKSDSCEVHAGVYSNPGARAGASSTLPSTACSRTECWNADIAFFGKGNGVGLTAPGTGYGDRTTPGLVIGARMFGVQDTWDSDGDKKPDCDGNSDPASCWGTCTGGTSPGLPCKVAGDCAGTGTTCPSNGEPTSYPAIFDGNADTAPMTICDTSGSNPATCNKGAFFSFMFGCGPASNGDGTVCSNTADAHKSVYIDANADGLFSASEELGPRSNGYNSSWITVKDIETRKHNGASACTANTGTRDLQQGSIAMVGAPTAAAGQGYVIDHVFLHDDLYASQGLCDTESNTAMLGDNINHNTSEPGVFKNSVAIVGQKFFINMDGGEYELVGGSKNIYDNIFVFPPRVKQPDGSIGALAQSWARFKGLDVTWNDAHSAFVPLVVAVWNNQITYFHVTSDASYPTRLLQTESWGRAYHAYSPNGHPSSECAEGIPPGANCSTAGSACGSSGRCGGFWTQGQGQFWFHGNIVRMIGTFSASWTRAYGGGCTISSADCPGCQTGNSETARLRVFEFNNTWDIQQPGSSTSMTKGLICDSVSLVPVTTYVDRNNAYFGTSTAVTQSVQPTTTVSCSTTGDRRCVANDACSGSQTNCTIGAGGTRTAWFAASFGTAGKNAGVFDGPANYAAKAAGPLDNAGSCDPDGNGVNGVDWNHDGVNDTSWTDIAGNTVNCAAAGSIAAGAVQVPAPVGQVCGNGTLEANASCLGLGNPYACCTAGVGNGTCEVCDDGNTVTETACNYGTPSCTLCNATCSAPLSLTGAYCGDSILNGSEFCDTGSSYVLPATCVSLGFAGGTLVCASGCASYNTSGCTTTAPSKTANALTLRGGTIH